jgi:hypothetical protein
MCEVLATELLGQSARYPNESSCFLDRYEQAYASIIFFRLA